MKIICDFFNRRRLTYGEKKIMGKLEEVLARQQLTLDKLKAVDEVVEGLFQLIKDLTGDGVTETAATLLLAKQDEIDAALAKVETDEEPTPSEN